MSAEYFDQELVDKIPTPYVPCGSLMVGCGSDFADPICMLPRGHKGVCLSPSASGNLHISEEDLKKLISK